VGADARADGIDVLVVAPHRHLRAGARLAGDGTDLDRAVVDLGHFKLEKTLDETRMRAGNHDLRASRLAAHVDKVDLDALTLDERLTLDLLAGEKNGVCRFRAGADAKGRIARAGIDARDDTGENFVLLGVVFVVDHAALGFAQALDDDLLAVARGDAAEFDVVDGNVDDIADIVLGGDGLRVIEAHLRAGVLDLIHDFLLHEHLEFALALVHIDHDVFHALVVALVGGGERLNDLIHHKGLRNAAFLFQHRKRCEDFITFHGYAPILYNQSNWYSFWLKVAAQAHERDRVLFKALFLFADAERDRAVVVAREVTGKFLAPVHGLVGLQEHGRAHELLKVTGPLERALRAGGRDLENVARLDGVGLVQNITQRAGDGLAVEDVHAAVLINVDPQIPLSGLADIFHVPELAAVLFDHGERQFAHGLCHFLHCIPRNPCFFRNLQKKERAKRSTLRFLHP
jgi:hypothetical protein